MALLFRRQASRLYRTRLCVASVRLTGPSRSLCASSSRQAEEAEPILPADQSYRKIDRYKIFRKTYSKTAYSDETKLIKDLLSTNSDRTTIDSIIAASDNAPKSSSTTRSRGSSAQAENAPEGELIDLGVDFTTQKLAATTFRDLCQCPACVDTSTRQKLFYTPDIPSDIRPNTVSTTARGVSVTWINDVPGYDSTHTTEVPIDVLQRICLTASPTPIDTPLPRSLWDAQGYETATRDYDYESYMANEAVLYHAVKQLHTHGLLFVQNVPEDEESVVKLAERIGPLKTTFYGRTWDVRSVPDAKNVAYTAQNLGFHMDLMYMEQPPHLQLLHCIRSSSKGGASLFTDSFRAVDEIARKDPVTFKVMSKKQVPYHYDHEEHYYRQYRSIVEERTVQVGSKAIQGWIGLEKAQAQSPGLLSHLTPADMVDSVAWSPPFQAPFGMVSDFIPPTSPTTTTPLGKYNKESQTWFRAAKVFNEVVHQPQAIYERLMKPGECVIFDNRRVLHARSAFDVDDVGKERWLKGAYIDKDPYMSKLKRLSEKFEGTSEEDDEEEDLVRQFSEVESS